MIRRINTDSRCSEIAQCGDSQDLITVDSQSLFVQVVDAECKERVQSSCPHCMKHCISRQKFRLVVGDSRPMSKRMLANCFRPPARLSGVRAVATQPNGSAQTSKLQQLYQQALSSFGKGQQPKGHAEVLAVSEALSKSGHLCSILCSSSVFLLLTPPSNILFRGNSPAGTGNANRGQCFPWVLEHTQIAPATIRTH